MQTERHLHKPVQNFRFGEELLLGVVDLSAEIAPVAILHNNAQRFLVRHHEGLVVADDVGVVQPFEEVDLELARVALLLRDILHLDHLYAHQLPLLFVPHQVHFPERALAQYFDGFI